MNGNKPVMSKFPPPLIMAPTAPHELTVILLHGRGSGPIEFSRHLAQSLFPSIKWIFPSAKSRQSSVFQMRLKEWFDIWSLSDVDEKWEIQLEGLGDSMRYVRDLIDDEASVLEKQGKSAKGRIVLGGLSMGCATSVHVLLSLLADSKLKVLAGFFGWCGWMPLRKMVEKAGEKGLKLMYKDLGLLENDDNEEAEGHPREQEGKVPVLLSHCTYDYVVDVKHGRQMKDALSGLGMNVKWTEYATDDHWFKEPEAVDELVQFLNTTLISLKADEIRR
jgi:lysophospholipase II